MRGFTANSVWAPRSFADIPSVWSKLRPDANRCKKIYPRCAEATVLLSSVIRCLLRTDGHAFRRNDVSSLHTSVLRLNFKYHDELGVWIIQPHPRHNRLYRTHKTENMEQRCVRLRSTSGPFRCSLLGTHDLPISLWTVESRRSSSARETYIEGIPSCTPAEV